VAEEGVMTRRAAMFTCLIAAVILAAGPAAAAWVLTLESPAGQTQTIELQDFNLGGETPATIGSATGGAGAGKIHFNEFTIKKTTDAASTTFFRNCVQGAHYKKVTLSMRKAGGDPQSAGKPFLVYHFYDVIVTSANAADHGVKFGFGRSEVENAPTPTPVVKPTIVAPKAVAPRKS
jgi:type VI protein secretion system component Hcp